jgi:hypothetical protein
LALVQVWFGTALFSPLTESGASWNGGYALLSAIWSLAGLAILALAVRNCVRLWRVPPAEASWALVASAVVVAGFSALIASGPMSSGVWRWWALIPGALATYLFIILGRELHRKLGVKPSQLVGS